MAQIRSQRKCFFRAYNPGQKLWPKLRKTALSLTPQAMHNQFKRPSVNFTIFIERLKTNESRDHYHEDGYLVPSPRYCIRFEAVSRL